MIKKKKNRYLLLTSGRVMKWPEGAPFEMLNIPLNRVKDSCWAHSAREVRQLTDIQEFLTENPGLPRSVLIAKLQEWLRKR